VTNGSPDTPTTHAIRDCVAEICLAVIGIVALLVRAPYSLTYFCCAALAAIGGVNAVRLITSIPKPVAPNSQQ
jgi:hypothetical protein